MPKLWTHTIDAHRRTVRDTILDAAASLADEQGLASLTMSGISERAGIGRATLYKYFSDVQQVLGAWHRQVVARHMREFDDLESRHSEPLDLLTAILLAYGEMARQNHGHAHAPFLHGLPHTTEAHAQLRARLSTIFAAGAATGSIRSDIAAGELADFALQAIAAANLAKNSEAVDRIVAMIRKAVEP